MLEHLYLDLGGEANLKKALALSIEVQQVDPKNEAVISDRGSIHYQLGQFELAADEFDQLTKRAPANVFAHFLCYTSLRRAGRKDKSQAYLRGLVGHLPPPGVDPSAAWNRSLLRYLSGKLDDRGLLAAIVSDDPYVRKARESSAYFYLGRSAQERGELALARTYFQKSRATQRRQFYQHALAGFELSQLDKARS